MFITEDIKYVGVNDRQIDLFEGQYRVPNGIAYNSYVIKDEKIAVCDTVDKRFAEEWLANIESELSGGEPDYLIVHHMEPDHSAAVNIFLEKYKGATVVATAKAFVMMKNFFGTDYEGRRVVVSDGDSLCLGRHNLTFITAPMVHWPEVAMSYDPLDKVLFSADGFGKFGALDHDEDWACEARRYYIGIVGKYGAQVQAVLKKAAGLDIKIICPLHGPVLKEDLGYYIDLYNIWSSYQAETEGVAIAYSSIYGNTREAALLLADELEKLGVKVSISDLARCDMAEAVEDAFRYSKLVLASPTYNGGVFPHMREFLAHLCERAYKSRTVALIENGSWAPMAAKVMREALAECKNITYAETNVKILSSLNEESRAAVRSLAKELSL